MVLGIFLHEREEYMGSASSAESVVREITRRSRKKYGTEEKIRIVLEGLRGEVSVAELCRKEGLNPNVYYKWSKQFLEAGKKRLQGDHALRRVLQSSPVS